MNDQNKQNQRPDETPKTRMGASSAAGSSSGLKKLIAKRWVSPAIFMAAAAIIVTLMWIYQGSDPAKPTVGPDNSTEVTQGEDQPVNQEGEGNDPAEIAASGEGMLWPVTNFAALQVEIPFYDAKGTEAEKEAALIQVGNTISPHMGVDFVEPDGATFDVLAALSGKVTQVIQHPTNGNTIEISHGDGLTTVYESLTNVNVAEGDDVEQGTIIAQAGRSDMEKDMGIHLHFEARLNGESVNPSDYIASN
ncbi:M23 family metallopeptidase [Paenibacillus sp. HB172176]|uniref:M23 family metallopeptidase n=1 Tax=Paenibacillus sp. HB172176 TaxID=2493690 RepID=UPI00143ABAF5|nr:M23 family metallopeptidase [Paenibacillus sp. HB172176]